MLQDEINFNNQYDDYDDDWVSKSSIKRKAKNLRELGIKMYSLSLTEIEKLPFDDDITLKEACLNAKKLKPNSEELRRQNLYIEALLRKREDDISKYENALKSIAGIHVSGNTTNYAIVNQRKKLIDNGIKEINALISQYPEMDRNKLRNLVKQAQKETSENKEEKKFFKELYQYLKLFIK